MDSFSSVKEMSLKWGISDRRVRILCQTGRIPGAFQVGRGWNIPSNAVKPEDKRKNEEQAHAETIEQKRSILSSLRSLTSGELAEINRNFETEYIYNSEAIDGSPLTLRETDLVLKGIVLTDKHRQYQQNVQNHKKAFDYSQVLSSSNVPLSIESILKLHSRLMEDHPEDGGHFRSIPVRFFSASREPTMPHLIQSELERLLYDYARSKDPLIVRLAKFHITFESIRPFIDGNGRIGRLLINIELIKNGYPPIMLKISDQKRYYDAFESYYYTGSTSAMSELISSCISEQLDRLINISSYTFGKKPVLNSYLDSIIDKFKYEGNIVSCEPLGKGNINRSYLVSSDTGRQYVLQKISTEAFHDVPGLMNNALLVSRHIMSKGGKSLVYIPSSNGGFYINTSNGEYWRSYEYIDAICLDHIEKSEDFYESAIAFGTFLNYLDDFPASSIVETIPHFHDTPKRYENLHLAIENDRMQRVKHVLPELEFARSREASSGFIMDMLSDGQLPLRVTHNDTKLNNVLFDKNTHKAISVIDLDTVMPGLAPFDFGDAIRSGANNITGNIRDSSFVRINLYLFRIYARGFLKAFPKLTDNEKGVLASASRLITLELGIRFLTDYIEGDRYFRSTYSEHNLDRARIQFKLVEDMEKHLSEMEAIIKEESFRFS